LPVQKHVAPPTPTWPPMDAFLAKVMDEFSGSTGAAGLDPMNYLDIDVNIDWPDYMHLQGSIKYVSALLKFVLCALQNNLYSTKLQRDSHSHHAILRFSGT